MDRVSWGSPHVVSRRQERGGLWHRITVIALSLLSAKGAGAQVQSLGPPVSVAGYIIPGGSSSTAATSTPYGFVSVGAEEDHAHAGAWFPNGTWRHGQEVFGPNVAHFALSAVGNVCHVLLSNSYSDDVQYYLLTDLGLSSVWQQDPITINEMAVASGRNQGVAIACGPTQCTGGFYERTREDLRIRRLWNGTTTSELNTVHQDPRFDAGDPPAFEYLGETLHVVYEHEESATTALHHVNQTAAGTISAAQPLIPFSAPSKRGLKVACHQGLGFCEVWWRQPAGSFSEIFHLRFGPFGETLSEILQLNTTATITTSTKLHVGFTSRLMWLFAHVSSSAMHAFAFDALSGEMLFEQHDINDVSTVVEADIATDTNTAWAVWGDGGGTWVRGFVDLSTPSPTHSPTPIPPSIPTPAPTVLTSTAQASLVTTVGASSMARSSGTSLASSEPESQASLTTHRMEVVTPTSPGEATDSGAIIGGVAAAVCVAFAAIAAFFGYRSRKPKAPVSRPVDLDSVEESPQELATNHRTYDRLEWPDGQAPAGTDQPYDRIQWTDEVPHTGGDKPYDHIGEWTADKPRQPGSYYGHVPPAQMPPDDYDTLGARTGQPEYRTLQLKEQ